MLWSLLPLLLACAFVEPATEPVELDPSDAVLVRIDTQRTRLQATDAGAELWRSLDAHGGLLRFERVGPWTVHLEDGRSVSAGEPLYAALTVPFAWANTPMGDTAPAIAQTVVLRTADGLRIDLDSVDRTVSTWADDEGLHEVLATVEVQGVRLVRELALPDGTTVRVTRWEPADPLPGWSVSEQKG